MVEDLCSGRGSLRSRHAHGSRDAVHARKCFIAFGGNRSLQSARGAQKGLLTARRWSRCRGVSHTIIEELVDSPASPFYTLGLAEHQEAGGYERAMRRQVHQLRRLKVDPTALALNEPPDWDSLFADPGLPLVVDLGCGAGRCILAAAAAQEARLQGRQEGGCAAKRPEAAAVRGTARQQRWQERGERGGYSGAVLESWRQQQLTGEVDACAAGSQRRRLGGGEADGGGRAYQGGPARAGGETQRGGGGSDGGGSGAGRANFLGVDVRVALTSRANSWAQITRLQHRVAFICANANASLSPLLESYGAVCRTATCRAAKGTGGHRTMSLSPEEGRQQCDDAGRANGSRICADRGRGTVFVTGEAVYNAAVVRQPVANVASFSFGRHLHGSAADSDRSDADAADGSEGAAAIAGSDNERVRFGSERGRGGGKVALICLQFSDPPIRRQALVGGDDLVAQLARALRRGALVWIQSDVLAIAESLRGLFWQHGGFAPSVRHAMATSAIRTRHWLPREPPPPAPLTATVAPPTEQPALLRSRTATPSGPSIIRTPAASPEIEAASAAVAATADTAMATATPDCAHVVVDMLAAAGAAQCRTSARRPAQMDACGSGDGGSGDGGSDEGRAAVVLAAAKQAVGLPMLLVEADLATHLEPWLAEPQVGAVVEQHRQRHRRKGQAGAYSAKELEGGCSGGDPGHACGQGSEERSDCNPPGWLQGGGGAVLEEGEGGDDGWAGLPWLDSNPLGIPTEREVYVERGGRPIYRLLLVRR